MNEKGDIYIPSKGLSATSSLPELAAKNSALLHRKVCNSWQ